MIAGTCSPNFNEIRDTLLKTIGCDEFNAYLAEARRPYDGINVEIDNIIAEGDQVAVRCSYHLMLEGEHTVVPVMADFRIKSGKIVEMWRTVAARRSWE
jgi:predicted SnoaL-like aldol condensation-catalyzing enzyme